MVVEIKPLTAPAGSRRDIGAIVTGINVNSLSDSEFAILKDALYRHQVLVLKDQQAATPAAQYELTRRFDPSSTSYGHGKALDAKRSILHPDLKTIPHQPQVQVIGNGFVDSYEGLENVTFKHPHHRTFHKDVLPEEDPATTTRFFRWHIDAALYDLHPPMVTSLMAVSVPAGKPQNLVYDDDTDDAIPEVSLGATAFASGYTAYDMLSEEKKGFVRTTKVEYAPHPYIWMSKAKSRPDGLGMVSEGKELGRGELPPIDEEKVQTLPMVWKNPVTGRLALQVHPSAVCKLHLGDGSVIDDLEEVREIVHQLQRPSIAPELVYCHSWNEGELVLFNNRGLIHSVTGSLNSERRIFRQCNVAASVPPLGPEDPLPVQVQV